MANHSPSNKVWLWMEDIRPKGAVGEPRLSLLNLTPLSSQSSLQDSSARNSQHTKLFRDNIMASDHLEMKISLQTTGSTLGKHEHVYKREPITNQPISGRKMHGKRETEQSMLAYTQKMQEISARKGTLVNEQQNANESAPLTKGTNKRWATLHKLRRQTLELRSVSDSHWNYGINNRQQQTVGPKGKMLQRPKSEVHQQMVADSNDTPRRPRSDSDGIIYNSSYLQGKGYNNTLDSYPLNHPRLQGGTNILSLPDITDSVESFTMDSAVQIVPFPGIEVQAVSLKVRSNSETLPKERKNVQNKVNHNHQTYKLSSQVQHAQVHNHKKTKKILKYQDRGKPSGSGTGKQIMQVSVSTDTSKNIKPLKVKQVTTSEDRGKRKKQIDSIHKKYANSSESKKTSCREKTPSISQDSPTNALDSDHQGATNDITIGIKSVLRTSEKKNKHRNSVHFGPQMIKEVTKIVYPWNNTSDNSASSEEEQEDGDSDDELYDEEIVNGEEYDSDEDYIYTDDDEDVENDL